MSVCFFIFKKGTPDFLRFYLLYTVTIPAAPQETVGEAGIELIHDSLVSARELNH
jgi:hypothetical protein